MNQDSLLLTKRGLPLGKILQDLAVCSVYELWEGIGLSVEIKL